MSDATELVDKYAGKLAKAMGDVAPEAWDIMVQGQIVSGIHDAVFAVIWAGAVAGAVFSMRITLRSDIVDHDKYGALACTGMAAIAFFGVSLNHLSRAILYLAAPEYQALLELLK